MVYHITPGHPSIRHDLTAYTSFYLLIKHLVILGVAGNTLELKSLINPEREADKISFSAPITNIEISPDERFLIIHVQEIMEVFEYRTPYSHGVEKKSFYSVQRLVHPGRGGKITSWIRSGLSVQYYFIRHHLQTSCCHQLTLGRRDEFFSVGKALVQKIVSSDINSCPNYLLYHCQRKICQRIQTVIKNISQEDKSRWFFRALDQHFFVYNSRRFFYWYSRQELKTEKEYCIAGILQLILSPNHQLLLLVKANSILVYRFPSMALFAKIDLASQVCEVKFLSDYEFLTLDIAAKVNHYTLPKLKSSQYLKYCVQQFGLFFNETVGCLFVDYFEWVSLFPRGYDPYHKYIRDNLYELNEPGYHAGMQCAFEFAALGLSDNLKFDVALLFEIHRSASARVANLVIKTTGITQHRMIVPWGEDKRSGLTEEGFIDLCHSSHVKIIIKSNPIDFTKTEDENYGADCCTLTRPTSWLYSTVMIHPASLTMTIFGIDIEALPYFCSTPVIINEINGIIKTHWQDIEKQSNTLDKLIILAKLLRLLNMLHFVSDGNGRMMLVAMMYCLHRLKLPPTLLFDPFDMLLMGATEFARQMQKGFSRLRAIENNEYQKVANEYLQDYLSVDRHPLRQRSEQADFIGNRFEYLVACYQRGTGPFESAASHQ